MAVFQYQAIDRNRAPVAGTVTADTPRQARDELRARGLLVQLLDEYTRRPPSAWRRRLFPGRTAAVWANTVHELSMLLRAGIPMLESLDTVTRQLRGSFKTALLGVRDRVAAGASLTEALSERPDLFDPLSVSLIEVGENAGNLEGVLEQLADFKQKSLQLKDQLLTALTYPLFLIVFGTAATIFLMTYVMPPLLENIKDSLQTLPWPTRVVSFCSDVLVRYGWLLAIFVAVVLFSGSVLLSTTWGRRIWHRFLLRLPILGQLTLKQSLARASMVIATLLRSGIVLTKAIDLAARSTTNIVVRDTLETCAREVRAGKDVSIALDRTQVLPPLAIQIFSIGQESGQLESMLDQLAKDYERQVATASARLASLLEPVLIVALAAMVGFVLVATILPILEAGNVL